MSNVDPKLQYIFEQQIETAKNLSDTIRNLEEREVSSKNMELATKLMGLLNQTASTLAYLKEAKRID